MAYVARPSDFHTDISPRIAPARRERRLNLWRWIYDGILRSRQRSANRDVAAFLARRGNRLTDSVEREIEAHMVNGGWQSRR